MARLTKSELLSPKTKEVHIADWGGEIVIRALSGRERQDIAVYHGSKEASAEPLRAQAMTVFFGCVEPAFDTVDEVMGLSGAGIQQAALAVMQHSGLSDPDEAKGN